MATTAPQFNFALPGPQVGLAGQNFPSFTPPPTMPQQQNNFPSFTPPPPAPMQQQNNFPSFTPPPAMGGLPTGPAAFFGQPQPQSSSFTGPPLFPGQQQSSLGPPPSLAMPFLQNGIGGSHNNPFAPQQQMSYAPAPQPLQAMGGGSTFGVQQILPQQPQAWATAAPAPVTYSTAPAYSTVSYAPQTTDYAATMVTPQFVSSSAPGQVVSTVTSSSYQPTTTVIQQPPLPISGGSVTTTKVSVLADTQVTLAPYFEVHDLEGFMAHAAQVTEIAKMEPTCNYHGFTFCGCAALCRESYQTAEGLLAHLQRVDQPFREGLLSCGSLVRMEVHGPPAELEKLRGPMENLNPDFFELMEGAILFKQTEGVEPAYPTTTTIAPVTTTVPYNNYPGMSGVVSYGTVAEPAVVPAGVLTANATIQNVYAAAPQNLKLVY